MHLGPREGSYFVVCRALWVVWLTLRCTLLVPKLCPAGSWCRPSRHVRNVHGPSAAHCGKGVQLLFGRTVCPF